MFNPTNLALEIFGILRSFDYTVNIFDFDGNRVYEPGDARRFFATPKNITVSIFDDGENSCIKLFLSQSTSAAEVSGLITTMRTTASKFGVLFNVRKYEHELKPKDLSPNADISYSPGVSIVNKGSTDTENHSNEVTHVEKIKDEVSNLTKDFRKIMHNISDKRKQKKVKESMETLNEGYWTGIAREIAETLPAEANKDEMVAAAIKYFNDRHEREPRKYLGNSTPNSPAVIALVDNIEQQMQYVHKPLEEKRGAEMIELPALGCSVELDAWEAFKNGKLSLYSAPEEFSDEQFPNDQVELITKLKAVAAKVSADGMANMFSRVAHALELGNESKLYRVIAKEAIKIGYSSELSEATLEEKRGAEMIALPALGDIEVEKDAWEKFKNGNLELYSPVDFTAELGSSVTPETFYLRQIADVTVADGMANMLARVADDLDVGSNVTGDRRKLARAIANMAISAAKAGGQADLTEGLIVTESVRNFMSWFDSLSHTKLFESDDEDRDRYRDSPEEENMAKLLGDSDPLSGAFEDAVDIAYNTVEDQFSVGEFLEQAGDDFNYNDETLPDEEKTVDSEYLKSSLIGYLRQKLEDILDGNEYPSEDDVSSLADKFLPDVIDTMESEGWSVSDPITECDTDLKNEDVLLPKNPKDDLTREVTAQKTDDDDADARRIIALARPSTL